MDSEQAGTRSTAYSRVAMAVLLVVSVLYFAGGVRSSRGAGLEGDEVFTMWIARDAPSVMAVLKTGADTAPPAFYALERGMGHLLGFTTVAMRVAPMVGFYVFLLSIFLLVRRAIGRAAGTAIGACAAVLPLFSSAADSAFLARPYGLVMGCFGLICLMWSADTSRRPAVWRGCCIAVLIAVGISMHFYGVLLVPLLMAMELTWTLRHGVIRWRNWIAAAAGAGSLVLSLPVILPIFRATHASAKATGYYAKPSTQSLLEFVTNIDLRWRMVEIYLWAVLLGCAVQGYRMYRDRLRPMEAEGGAVRYEDSLGAVGLAGLLYPLMTFGFAVVVTKVFNERYMLGAVLGASVGLALVLRRLRWSETPAMILLLLMSLLYANLAVAKIRSKPSHAGMAELITSVPQGEPVVVPSGASFFVFEEWNDPGVRERVTYMLPPEGTHNPNPEPERLAVAWKSLRPELNVVSCEELLAQHKRFYLLTNDEDKTETVTAWAVQHFHVRLVNDGVTWKLLEVTQ